ncbi:hypothetical protein PIB30_093696 [Stylosanthes scabra]|uniref:Uncharacterized protein n=1 Tax=Stylosanthes scabra TaxID=79078 RepID=A0ABU6XRX3_9FABA|nr:hypothetical protein [Stylosanthes scabra]
MLEERSVVEKGLVWRVGSGTQIKIFEDPWLQPPYPYQISPVLFPEAAQHSIFWDISSVTSQAAGTILSTLASKDANSFVGPSHSPSLMGLLLMRHKPIKMRHARERYPHPYKACFVLLSNRCGTLPKVRIPMEAPFPYRRFLFQVLADYLSLPKDHLSYLVFGSSPSLTKGSYLQFFTHQSFSRTFGPVGTLEFLNKYVVSQRRWSFVQNAFLWSFTPTSEKAGHQFEDPIC